MTYSKARAESVGTNFFKGQERIKVRSDDGEIRWYLDDGEGGEYAIVSRRNLEVLHFRRVLGGWLAFEPEHDYFTHGEDQGYPG